MTPTFAVRITPGFEREYRRLLKGHTDLARHYATALTILADDPYNRSRTHAILKLHGVATGEGQFRFRTGRFRFRYDIEESVVFLKYCSLRRNHKG